MFSDKQKNHPPKLPTDNQFIHKDENATAPVNSKQSDIIKIILAQYKGDEQ